VTLEQIVLARLQKKWPMIEPDVATEAVAALRETGAVVCTGHQSTDREWEEALQEILKNPDSFINPDGESPR
jgi:hypothetical protein